MHTHPPTHTHTHTHTHTGYTALANVDPKEVDTMLDQYLSEPAKYGSDVFNARIKDRRIRKDIELNSKSGKEAPKEEEVKAEL